MGFISDLAKNFAAAGISSIPAVAGGIIRSRAAGSAARQQAESERAALEEDRRARAEALAQLTASRDRQVALSKPYADAGAGAVSQLSELLKPGGALYEGFNREFKAPTQEEVLADPGYDFGLREGQKALERSAAARGTLNSGATGKALERYGTDYATTKYQNVYDRVKDEYDMAERKFRQDQGDRFSRLSELTRVGESASGSQAGYEGGYGSGVAGLSLGGGAAAGQAAANLGEIGARRSAARGNIWAPVVNDAAGYVVNADDNRLTGELSRMTTRSILDQLRPSIRPRRSTVGREDMALRTGL